MATTTTATETSISNARQRRRQSFAAQYAHHITCQPLPASIEALDLSSAFPAAHLASLRILVLSYLADLETRLSQLDSPLSDLKLAETWKSKGEIKVEEARAWARDGIEMLRRIRDDVCSHLPELNIDSATVENYVSARLQELPDVPSFKDVTSHLPDMPDVRAHLPQLNLPDMRSRIDDVYTRFSDIDLHHPMQYIPTLSNHLQTLQSHLSSTQFPYSNAFSALTPNAKLVELLDILRANSPSVENVEGRIGRAARDVKSAIQRSLHGARLIHYSDLPEQWRNNPFVTHGYRFIPLSRWPLIIMSVFALHNETLNIHTHLIPLVLWIANLVPAFGASSIPVDVPVTAFSIFAMLCLFSSVIWHTMSGCAHHRGMDLCAKLDYAGIGWLISASVATIVYYGFPCQDTMRNVFLGICVLKGVTATMLCFSEWFNRPENKRSRTAFFVAIALASLAPLTCLAFLHSTSETLSFMRPIAPSLLSYVMGLVFYVSHFPERALPPHWGPRLAWLGGGSHAIWHVFVVLAIAQHRSGMHELKGGIGGDFCLVV
ncbi:hypothetical protein EVG20_g6156 [Dentipellis fragilis]|uniref:HlyIII-domain-containing protein n=1 Tax=Dentipellis fragilis TaxID=205917 RepID=A0A4Y9YN59_9AGAM|nr:hypothetical protein EVG20_g6156 [Dentipellis fragilis]